MMIYFCLLWLTTTINSTKQKPFPAKDFYTFCNCICHRTGYIYNFFFLFFDFALLLTFSLRKYPSTQDCKKKNLFFPKENIQPGKCEQTIKKLLRFFFSFFFLLLMASLSLNIYFAVVSTNQIFISYLKQ